MVNMLIVPAHKGPRLFLGGLETLAFSGRGKLNTSMGTPIVAGHAPTLPDRTLVRYHCWMQRQQRERHLLMPSTSVDGQ